MASYCVRVRNSIPAALYWVSNPFPAIPSLAGRVLNPYTRTFNYQLRQSNCCRGRLMLRASMRGGGLHGGGNKSKLLTKQHRHGSMTPDVQGCHPVVPIPPTIQAQHLNVMMVNHQDLVTCGYQSIWIINGRINIWAIILVIGAMSWLRKTYNF